MVIMKSFDKDYKISYSSKDFSIHANHALESYGKSFHWARYFLGSKTAKNATLLYVFCRYLDDLADNKNTNNFDALNIIYKTILNPENSNSKNPYIRSFINLSKENNIPTFPAEDLLLGLINDQNKVRIKDETQLIRYSYQVAGTVGLMMAYILGVKNERAYDFAIDLGIAMQLTNIARDVLEDAKFDRRYVPGSWCNNILPSNIINCANNELSHDKTRIILATNRILSLAEKYYDSGISGLTYLSKRNHIAIGIAAIIYRLIGRKIKKRGTKWWKGREVISLGGKAINSFFVIPILFNRIDEMPTHNITLHKPLKGFFGVNRM